MNLSRSEINDLVAEIAGQLGARRDGSGRNLIAQCPVCSKQGKYGVYIGPDMGRKRTFMSHCFSCGFSTQTLEKLLESIGRPDLMIAPTTQADAKLDTTVMFPLETEDEVDDSLGIVELPEFYRRTFDHPYLKKRGFVFDDFEYFPVGTTRGLNRRYDDYVIFPILDAGDVVGYVARHLWPKDEIDAFNRRARVNGDYRIMRFRNSTENDFVKLLYNYDAVREDVTDTVVLVEGIFDVVSLTRKLELYDNDRIAVVATFGKKISQVQIYKLQAKGVRTVVIGYDPDAVEAIKKTATDLTPFFDVIIADIPFPDKDWEDLSHNEIYQIFSTGLKTPIEYKINKIQQYE